MIKRYSNNHYFSQKKGKTSHFERGQQYNTGVKKHHQIIGRFPMKIGNFIDTILISVRNHKVLFSTKISPEKKNEDFFSQFFW